MADMFDQLKLDLDEVKRLLPLAARQRIKGVLSIEIGRIEADINRLEKTDESRADGSITKTIKASPLQQITKELPFTTIKTYGWDQSDKFTKVYVTVAGVKTVPSANVTVNFGDQSFKLVIRDLDGFNHQLNMPALLHEIIVKDSYFKVKTDSVVVFLKKRQQSSWSYLTKVEQKMKDKSKIDAKPADNKDPNAGLMDMMKKMYDDGDDDMKRTIAKAWTESRDKQGTGDMGM